MTSTDIKMMAISIEGGRGPASALKLEPTRFTVPKDGQLLIKVRAAGVNRPDIFQRLGLYPPPVGASDILGLEVAGEVVRAAGRWEIGDHVCALVPGGGYAQLVSCDPRHALPIPEGLTFEEAAGLPETVFTVYANAVEDGRLKAGETMMVHGATSGIGITAIQMGKALGAKVIATARSADKAKAALAFGADVVVDTSREDFAEIAKREGGVDVILNMVGGDYFSKDMASLKMGGRIVFIAALGGSKVSLEVFPLMQKRAIVTGSTLRARSDDEKARLAQEVERVVWPMVVSGAVKVQIDKTFWLEDAALAHAHLEAGTHVGKVMLSVG